MTNSYEHHPIVGGPSKWDLSVALFDRKVENFRKVRFNANVPLATNITVQVTSVQAVDGSGEAWNIEGYATKVERDKDTRANFVPPPPSRVFIYFRTDRRQGHIRFFNPTPIAFISPETIVRTIRPNESKRKEWTEEGWASRQWGVTGKVLTHHDSHGLCYEVQHEDQSVGYYDPSELEVID